VTRKKAEQAGKSGAGVAQSSRRRKYLLSGLLPCGNCGGNLTAAWTGHRRRYDCANAKEKGDAVCTAMPGLSETDAADAILSCLRTDLMEDSAYEQFRAGFTEQLRAEEHDSGDALRRHDAQIKAKASAHEDHNVRGLRTCRGERCHVLNKRNLLGRRRKVSTAGREQLLTRIVLPREWRWQSRVERVSLDREPNY